MTDQFPELSVIIPAPEDGEAFERTLHEYAEEFKDGEIIAVLNERNAEASAAGRRCAATYPNVRAVGVAENVGKGGAIRIGFLVNRSPVVAFADGDGSVPAIEIRRLTKLLGDYDGVIGSRWLRGAVTNGLQPWRKVASKTLNAMMRLLFGIPFRDTQCGAKVFHAAAFRELFTHVETSNLAFDLDLLYLMRKRGKRIIEVPTVWNDVTSARLSVPVATTLMLASLMRMRLRHSALSIVIPLFDKLLPTSPMRAYERFSILILNHRDIRHPQAGGAEIFLHEQAVRWVVAGHTVEWLTAGYPGCQKREVVDGIAVTRIGGRISVYFLVPFEYLRNFRNRFDVVVDVENGLPFFSPLFSMKPKVGVICHVHRTNFLAELAPPLASLLTWIEAWLAPRIYRKVPFVTISEDTKSEMERQRMSWRPIHIVRPGVGAHLSPGAKAERPTALYLGRLRRYKRVDLLIESFSSVVGRMPQARLVIAGTGDDEGRLRRLVIDRGLGDSVSFEGHVNEERKVELLRAAWVFVSPSLVEGWGISVIEANACGTPAIVFSVPGLREAVIDGVSGVVVPEGTDPSGAILRLLGDHAERQRLARGAIARAREFSWDATGREMLDVIVRQIASGGYGLVHDDAGWSLVTRPINDSTDAIVTAVSAQGNALVQP